MAKKHSNNSTAPAQASTKPSNGAEPREQLPKRQLPEGYAEQSSDVVGFWDPSIEGAELLHFVPTEAKLNDSTIDERKPSTLILGTLIDPIPLALPGDDDETVEGKPGDLVGVWAKPGMAGIKKCAGVPTMIYEHGEKEVGKPNPMKVFVVACKGRGRILEVSADNRKASRHAKTFLTAGEQETNPARDQARREVQDEVKRRTAGADDGTLDTDDAVRG